jgi:DNA-binding NtrC family response regulator
MTTTPDSRDKSNTGHKNDIVLIVDDEITQRRLVDSMIVREGYRTRTASDGEEALRILQGPEAEYIGAVLLDLSMPKAGGIQVLKAIRPKRPKLPIIVLTAHSSLNNAVESMRAGASDFLVKPTTAERIKAALASAFHQGQATGELRPLTEKLSSKLTFEQMVGSAPAFKNAIALAKRAAGSLVPVLIDGESGVGKELIAQSIASASTRADKPFVAVNCGALPANLVESILFGHERGAFTGAIDKHMGKFQQADGGTLFLDEIGELPLDAQVKLLRALQEGEISPIGARNSSKIDVRVISATNRDLLQEIAAGRFREDLYYRLNVIGVHIPPLRERAQDIPGLVRHFLARITASEGIGVHAIDQEALNLLQSFDWPGNVRQLQNAIFRAAVLCEGSVLGVRDFPQLLARKENAPSSRLQSQAGLAGLAGGPTQAALSNHLALLDSAGHLRSMDELERDIIRKALHLYEGRMSEVARRLKIGRSTLYRRLAELGLETP